MTSRCREVTLGLIQMKCVEDLKTNLDHAMTRIAAAAQAGAQIICLPELFRSRYFCQTNDKKFFELAEPVPGPSTEALSRIARDKKVVIVVPLFERERSRFSNTVCVIDAGGKYLGKYRKVHIPDDPQNYYSEKYYFQPGDLGFPVFETRYAKIGLQVCWDQWFPEGARALALNGAEIILYPTAIGWSIRSRGPSPTLAKIGERYRSLPDGPSSDSHSQLDLAEFDAWVTVQRGHAISNTVFIGAVNRTGREDHLDFWGGSFVADPLGRILKQASQGQEENLIVPCDLGRIAEVRKDWPFLTCRRTDVY